MKENTSSPQSVSGDNPVLAMRKGFDKRCLEDAVSAICFYFVHSTTVTDPFKEVLNGIVNVLGYDNAILFLEDSVLNIIKD